LVGLLKNKYPKINIISSYKIAKDKKIENIDYSNDNFIENNIKLSKEPYFNKIKVEVEYSNLSTKNITAAVIGKYY
jgi:hypothetical protein